MDDIDKELESLFDDPLLAITPKEAALFDIPADMRLVMKHREKADYVARYTPCENFGEYKTLFEQVHADLRHGKRSIIKVAKTASLQPGHYYVIDGVMLYLEKVGNLYKDEGTGLPNARTRCILENGTETDVYLQTLRKSVVSNGYGITESNNETALTFKNADLTDSDQSTGFIYVLSSLSQNPQIVSQENLYKIGFTVNTVEERIVNASNDPTYLMAPVKIEATYRIVNLNSHKFETLIHQVLDAVQMNFTVYDQDGKEHHPKEWFVAPLQVIDTIIFKIFDGTITKYTYNPAMKCLEKVINKAESTFNTSGFKVLTLRIKKGYFDEIMSGEKDIEYRELKQTTLNKYTYLDENDGKRYLKWYDMLRLYVGYQKDAESAIVEVKDITYKEGIVEYHLGKILEHVKVE